jgi:hypothetical protein
MKVLPAAGSTHSAHAERRPPQPAASAGSSCPKPSCPGFAHSWRSSRRTGTSRQPCRQAPSDVVVGRTHGRSSAVGLTSKIACQASGRFITAAGQFSSGRFRSQIAARAKDACADHDRRVTSPVHIVVALGRAIMAKPRKKRVAVDRGPRRAADDLDINCSLTRPHHPAMNLRSSPRKRGGAIRSSSWRSSSAKRGACTAGCARRWERRRRPRSCAHYSSRTSAARFSSRRSSTPISRST